MSLFSKCRESIAKTDKKDDCEKMQAFISFHKLATQRKSFYFAWYEPQFKIEKASAVYFLRRFPTSSWAIGTPEVLMLWTGRKLIYIEGNFVEESSQKLAFDIYDQLSVKYRRHRLESSAEYFQELQNLLLAKFSGQAQLPCLSS